MKPKVLFLDIETAPNTAYVWGLWDQNISNDHLKESSYVLCYSAKWLGEASVHFSSVQRQSRKSMLKSVHILLNAADVVVHHNGTKFDIPVLNKEFIKHGFRPPSPYKQVDTLKVCRSAFRFESNKLDALLTALDIGKKVKNRGFSLWVGCMEGDKGCWREMEAYNKGDVVQLERLYNRVLPWIERHPNLGVYINKPACTNCGSTKVQRRGREIALTQWYKRYQCQSCGKWFKGEKEKNGRHTKTSAHTAD